MTTFSLEKTAALVSAIPTNLGPQNDEIGTQEYIVAYHELIKFFDGLGKVFGFITSDVTSKLAKLEEHEIQGKKHPTLQQLVEGEVAEGLVSKTSKNDSCTRHLLRLHRALEFIIEFLLRLKDCDNDAAMSKESNDAYTKTLSKHHPWLIRKSVGVALYTLPARRQLLEWLSVTEADIGVHAEGLITKLREVYQNIETYYAKHDFLNLP
eukprot:Colp12_sorted_trinity150504_noHs@2569